MSVSRLSKTNKKRKTRDRVLKNTNPKEPKIKERRNNMSKAQTKEN